MFRTLLHVSNGNTGGGATQFAALGSNPALAAADFDVLRG
jgi:hypothetical protein